MKQNIETRLSTLEKSVKNLQKVLSAKSFDLEYTMRENGGNCTYYIEGDEYPARIICTDFKTTPEFPVIALVLRGDEEELYLYGTNGIRQGHNSTRRLISKI